MSRADMSATPPHTATHELDVLRSACCGWCTRSENCGEMAWTSQINKDLEARTKERSASCKLMLCAPLRKICWAPYQARDQKSADPTTRNYTHSHPNKLSGLAHLLCLTPRTREEMEDEASYVSFHFTKQNTWGFICNLAYVTESSSKLSTASAVLIWAAAGTTGGYACQHRQRRSVLWHTRWLPEPVAAWAKAHNLLLSAWILVYQSTMTHELLHHHTLPHDATSHFRFITLLHQFHHPRSHKHLIHLLCQQARDGVIIKGEKQLLQRDILHGEHERWWALWAYFAWRQNDPNEFNAGTAMWVDLLWTYRRHAWMVFCPGIEARSVSGVRLLVVVLGCQYLFVEK